jgi:hypothetical protein
MSLPKSVRVIHDHKVHKKCIFESICFPSESKNQWPTSVQFKVQSIPDFVNSTSINWINNMKSFDFIEKKRYLEHFLTLQRSLIKLLQRRRRQNISFTDFGKNNKKWRKTSAIRTNDGRLVKALLNRPKKPPKRPKVITSFLRRIECRTRSNGMLKIKANSTHLMLKCD